MMQTWGDRAGNNISFWERTAKKFRTAPLEEHLTTDICVVGGGLAGVTTAYLLAREWK
jgi:ribulose 1,5-bisphosphate synthetase/thiazole synthase